MRQQDYAGEVSDGWLRQGHQFDRQRFADLVRYVSWICEDPRVLGLERLSRILWYVDRNLYLTRDRVATGASYLRYRNGPWARPLAAVLHELERSGVIALRARIGDGEPDLLVSLAKPDLGRFDPDEISLVEAVTRALCFDTRSSVPDKEAHDTVLHAARLGETIPYFTVFAGRPGEPTPGDLAWAARESGRKRQRPAAAPALAGRAREAVEALFWHLQREPSLGASLPTTGASWFVYKQRGIAAAGVPEVRVVYRFDADELLVGAIAARRPGAADEEDGEAE